MKVAFKYLSDFSLCDCYSRFFYHDCKNCCNQCSCNYCDSRIDNYGVVTPKEQSETCNKCRGVTK